MSKPRRNRSRTSRKGRNRSSGFDWWRLARQLQLILTVIVPFLLLPGFYNWVELPRGSLIQVGVVVILLVWLMGAVSQSKLRISRTPFDLPLLGFVSWAGLSLFWAHNFYEGFQIWIQWGACLVLFFLTVNLVHAEKDVRRLLRGLLISGTLVAVLGICQYLLEVKWVPQLVPPAATFANRNMAAQFMVVTIPLAVGFFLLSRKRVHVLLTATSLGILSLFLFYTSTRAAWLAATAAFLFVGICLARDRFKWQLAPPMEVNKRKALAVCIVLIFVLINLTPSGFQWQVGTAYNRIREVLPGAPPRPVHVPDQVAQVNVEDASLAQPIQATAQRRDSISVRFLLWRNTLRMGTEHFIKGVGVGNFRVFYPRYVRSAVVDPVFSGGGQWGKAHNDYAQIFAELGLVGLFFLGWFLFALMKTSVALLWKKTEGELRYLVMAVMAALVGLSVNAFFSFPFQLATPTFIFAIYVGILGGCYARQPPQDKSPLPHHSKSLSLPSGVATVGAALSVLLLLILLPFEFNRLRVDWYYRRIDTALSKEAWAEVISQVRKAQPYASYRKDFLFAAGRAYFETESADAAIEANQELLEAYPYYLNAHHNIGVAYALKGETDLAFEHFDRVFEIVPGYGKTHYVVAQLREKNNQLDEALEHYRLAVEDENDNSRFLEKLGKAALKKELFSEAKEAFGKAVKNDPSNSGYYLQMGIAATRLEEYEEARAVFRRAVELAPESDEAHYRLGMLLVLIFNEKEEGSQHLQKVLTLKPSGTYAVELRRLIEDDPSLAWWE